MKNNISHNCVVCGKTIRRFDSLPKSEDWEGMWDGGIVDKISAGYGSVLDGNIYILAICDDCVKEKKLPFIRNYMFPGFDNNF